MAKTKSSQRWLKEHFDDEFVKRAQKEGYRSRAVYKLLEIQKKDRLIQPSMRIIDLGAAPGSWSQLIADWVGRKGTVLANDILPIDPIAFVDFVQGDFRDDDVLETLLNKLDGQKADVIVSDMAPNMSGTEAIDIPRAMYLCELALDMVNRSLKLGGTFLIKMFQGEGSDEYLKSLRLQFKTVKIRKPKASRPRSREVYVVAQHFLKK